MAIVKEETLQMEEIPVAGYEKVIKVTDRKTGLKAIICIHNTTLGPALGGIRIYPYASFDAALNDVMRLSKGMTYKSALSEVGWGGGKSVIIANSKTEKTEELLLAFGAAVDSLCGQYICAEDVGCSPQDVLVISKATPYVVGLPHDKSSGNPSPFTAYGTFRGIQSTMKKIYGSDSLQDKTVAVQGLGSVGSVLVDLLFWAGAKLIISDIDMDKTESLARQYGAKVAPVDQILYAECDVLSPCAMGGIVNDESIPKLRCKAIAGCANNQLLKDSNADDLFRRGILYAPDFVINAGGLINVNQELEPAGYHPVIARNRVHKLYDQLITIYEIAQQNRFSTHTAAVSLGDYRLKYGLTKRKQQPCFHHAALNI